MGERQGDASIPRQIEQRLRPIMDEIKRALVTFPSLAQQAGLPQTGWSARILSRRKDARMYRLIIGLSQDGYPDLALKKVFHPDPQPEFLIRLQRQQALWESGVPTPEILSYTAADQSILMHRFQGQTLFDATETVDSFVRFQAFAAAGRWVERFHRVSGVDTRLFNPKPQYDFLEKHRANLLSGSAQVARQKPYLAAVETMFDLRAGFEGQETIGADRHGDLNMRNIMVAGPEAIGLDFRTAQRLPVAQDLAVLAVHFGALNSSIDSSNNRIDLDQAFAGFFSGYGLISAQDAAYRCILRMRILNDWRAIPKDRIKRTRAEQRRFLGLVKLANWAFGP